MNNKDILNLKFKICDTLKYSIDDMGIVTIHEKQDDKIQNILRKLKIKIPMYKDIELDEYCSTVFSQINGINTVEYIGIILQETYGQEVLPLYERLLLFINHISINCNYIERIN